MSSCQQLQHFRPLSSFVTFIILLYASLILPALFFLSIVFDNSLFFVLREVLTLKLPFVVASCCDYLFSRWLPIDSVLVWKVMFIRSVCLTVSRVFVHCDSCGNNNCSQIDTCYDCKGLDDQWSNFNKIRKILLRRKSSMPRNMLLRLLLSLHFLSPGLLLLSLLGLRIFLSIFHSLLLFYSHALLHYYMVCCYALGCVY